MTPSPTRQLLLAQRNAIVSRISPDAEPFAKVMANRMVAKIDGYLAWRDEALACHAGMFGENGHGPAVEDICRQLEFRPFTCAVPVPGHGFPIVDADDDRIAA